MAESTNTPSRPQSLSHIDIEALAERLLARGTSKLTQDNPHMAGDMRTASRVIRGLLDRMHQAAGHVADAQRLLSDITVKVEG
jgi:hypothetical protein